MQFATKLKSLSGFHFNEEGDRAAKDAISSGKKISFEFKCKVLYKNVVEIME